MRTTIELTDKQRAELLRLAARRGFKGLSPLVQEAIDQYLAHQGEGEAIATDLSLKGCLSGSAGDKFEQRAKAMRELWRCS